MIFGQVSVMQVISKIVRDLNSGPAEIPWQDYIEWIAEGLKHVGVYYQFEEKEKLIVIEDHKGRLPCDLHSLIRLRNPCPLPSNMDLPGVFTVEGFNAAIDDFSATCDNQDFILPPKTRNLLVAASSSLSRVFNNDRRRDDGMIEQSHLIGDPSGKILSELDYNVTLDKIVTGFKQGFIECQYLSFPCDDDGFPTVPDNVSYMDALFWKVAYHLALRGFEFKQIKLRDPEYCYGKWSFYCMQSRGAGNMPDSMMMERLKNNWLKINIDLYPETTDYKFLGRPNRVRYEGFDK